MYRCTHCARVFVGQIQGTNRNILPLRARSIGPTIADRHPPGALRARPTQDRYTPTPGQTFVWTNRLASQSRVPLHTALLGRSLRLGRQLTSIAEQRIAHHARRDRKLASTDAVRRRSCIASQLATQRAECGAQRRRRRNQRVPGYTTGRQHRCAAPNAELLSHFAALLHRKRSPIPVRAR